MGRIVQLSEPMYVSECPVCGITYAIPEEYRDKKEETGQNWHCPNGHSLVITGPSLQTQLDRVKQQVTSGEALDGRRLDYIRSLRKTIENGPCPECGKLVSDMKGHRRRVHGVRARKKKKK